MTRREQPTLFGGPNAWATGVALFLSMGLLTWGAGLKHPATAGSAANGFATIQALTPTSISAQAPEGYQVGSIVSADVAATSQALIPTIGVPNFDSPGAAIPTIGVPQTINPETTALNTDIISTDPELIPSEVINDTPDLFLLPAKYAIRPDEAELFVNDASTMTENDAKLLKQLIGISYKPENMIDINGENYVMNAAFIIAFASANNSNYYDSARIIMRGKSNIQEVMLEDARKILDTSDDPSILINLKDNQILELMCSLYGNNVSCVDEDSILRFNGNFVTQYQYTLNLINQQRLK